jgi:hypothetical protein
VDGLGCEQNQNYRQKRIRLTACCQAGKRETRKRRARWSEQ